MNDNKIKKHTTALQKTAQLPEVPIVDDAESVAEDPSHEEIEPDTPPPDYPIEYHGTMTNADDVDEEMVMEEDQEVDPEEQDTEAEVKVQELDFESTSRTAIAGCVTEHPLDCPICLAQYYTAYDYETHIRSHYADKQVRGTGRASSNRIPEK